MIYLMEPINPTCVYDRKEARALLRVGRDPFRNLIKKGHLHPSKVDGKSYRFLGSELIRCLENLQYIK